MEVPTQAVPNVSQRAFADARQKLLSCEILSAPFEHALWLAAFTGDVHVEVHSGMITRCLWSERSGVQPPPDQIAVRERVKPPRLSQESCSLTPSRLAIDTLTGKVVATTP